MDIRLRSFRWFAIGALVAALATLAATAASAGPGDKPAPAKPAAATRATATFAAGCFWSMEAIFKQLKGVVSAAPGYSGGKLAHPSYEQVETGTTGHAESLNIVFDPRVISYRDLLDVLLTVRNPTTLNRQGNDEGPQYRSIVFYRTEEQRRDARDMIAKFNAAHVWPGKIVTEIQPFTQFYPAENYHIDYYKLHPNEPYCANVIAPDIVRVPRQIPRQTKVGT